MCFTIQIFPKGGEMKEQILKMVDLQNIDTKIYNINKELSKLPRDLDKLLEEFNPRQKKYNNKKNNLKEMEAENLKCKMELDENTSKLKSLQERLSKVQNAKELSAVDKEINGIKNAIGETEEKNIKLLDDIDDIKKEISEEDQVIKEEKKRVDELNKKIKIKTNETSGELKTLERERMKIANTLPQELLDKYEFIFEKKEGKAIVAVKEEVCTGCYMSIPPQVISDIRKGFEIFYCQYCSRMLYYPEWEN